MSRSALTSISTVDQLRSAWEHVYGKASPSSRLTIGSDGESLDSVRPHIGDLLGRLSYELRHQQFAFHPLRAVVVRKKNGKDRVICVPTVQDRIVQRSLLMYLSTLNRLRILNQASYGFIPGLSSPVRAAGEYACRLRKAHPWVYKTDISAFFDNIPRPELIAKIDAGVRAVTIRRLLGQAAKCEIGGASKTGTWEKGCTWPIRPGKQDHRSGGHG